MNILESADIEFKNIRESFFDECIAEIKSIEPRILIVNDKMNGKSDILLKAFQIESISSYMIKININHRVNSYSEKIFKHICGNKYKKCTSYAKCYHEFGDKKFNKKIFYFSIDISKYIFGFLSDIAPAKFPCINSYLSHDIPKEILVRTTIMSTALSISKLVPDFSVATITLFNSILENNDLS